MHNKKIILLLLIIFPMTVCFDFRNLKKNVPGEMEEKIKIDETISIVVVGDNLLHSHVVNSGKQEDGTYDYSHIFKNIQPIFREADIAVINQETIFGGDELGFSGYPSFNSPTDMGRTLVKEGFDVILQASNHTLDKGVRGVENAMAFWKEYPEVSVLGVNESEKANRVKIRNVKGANIALLNYTYDVNSGYIPEGKEYIINLIDEKKIKEDAEYAEENADFTIAFMHWGDEYSLKENDIQKELAEKMCNWGVDLIVGAHPHVLQPIEKIEGKGENSTLVYYSLGNFVSSQRKVQNLLGGLADVKLHYDGEKVTISDYNLIPLVTHYDENLKTFSVYKFDEYSDEMAMKHGVAQYDGDMNKERLEGILEQVSGDEATSKEM